MGVSLQAKKCELSPSVGYYPHQKIEFPCPLIIDHILVKKVSLIAFRQIFSKILLDAYIFSNTIKTYLKKLIGTKSINTKQYQSGLSPRIISHYPPPPTSLFQTFMGNPGDGEESHPTVKYLLISPTRKILSINLLLPLSKISFLPHQIEIFI